MRRFTALLIALSALLSTFHPAGRASSVSVPTQKYLMSFNVCLQSVSDCNNPQNHSVLLAQSDDGKSWSLLQGWTASKGSVPDLFRRGDTIYLYDTQGLTKINVKTGEITKTRASITSGESFVDPSLAQLPDGRLILFYLPGMRGGDPAQCAAGETTCQKMIKSAVEVAGSDGTSFVEDPGMRVSATLSSTGEDRVFSDPDIFFNGTDWVLYVSRGRGTEAYTSKDLQGSYSNKVNLTNGKGGVPSGIFDESSSKVWTYTHANVAGEQVIRRTVSDKGLSGASNDSDYQSIITTSFVSSLGYKIVGSPGVAINNAGIECQVCNPKPTPTPTPTATPTPTPTPTVSPSATPAQVTPVASATPAASASATSKKKVSITCVKGKQIKKVSGTNPKCPQGFKKK
ncbi:MAG: hypothetical protein ACO23S_03875 [Candidatus Nanopelagicaceae bacterium]